MSTPLPQVTVPVPRRTLLFWEDLILSSPDFCGAMLSCYGRIWEQISPGGHGIVSHMGLGSPWDGYEAET